MAQTKLGILIETVYKGQGAKQATKDLAGLETAADKSTSGMDKLRAGFGQIALAAGAAGAAVVVAKKGWDFAKEGAQLLKVTDTFDALNTSIDTTSDTMLIKLRQATQGMVSDIELMGSANRFLSMGLATTADEAANLAEVAVKLGGAMGRGPTEAMEEFSLLLANQSIPRLDSFGISAGRVRERISELQSSMPGLTREMAFMEAVTAEAAISMEKLADVDVADPFTQTEVAVKNLTDRMKTGLAQGVLPMIEALNQNQVIYDAMTALYAMGEASDYSGEQVQFLVDHLESAALNAESMNEATRLLASGMGLTAIEVLRYSEAAAAANMRSAEMTSYFSNMYPEVDKATVSFNTFTGAVDLSRAALDLFIQGADLEEPFKKNIETTAQATVENEKYSASLESIIRQVQAYTSGSPYSADFEAWGLDELDRKISELLRKLNQLGGTRPGEAEDPGTSGGRGEPPPPPGTGGSGNTPPGAGGGAGGGTQAPAFGGPGFGGPTVQQNNVFNNVSSPAWVAQRIARNTAEAWGNSMRG